MTTQLNNQEIIETIAVIKGWNANEIKNADFQAKTVEYKNAVYSFELTGKKRMVKINSINFLWTVSQYENCSYGA